MISNVIQLIEMHLKDPVGRDVENTVKTLHKAGYKHDSPVHMYYGPGGNALMKNRSKSHMYYHNKRDNDFVMLDYPTNNPMGTVGWTSFAPKGDSFLDSHNGEGANRLHRHLFKTNVVPFKRREEGAMGREFLHGIKGTIDPYLPSEMHARQYLGRGLRMAGHGLRKTGLTGMGRKATDMGRQVQFKRPIKLDPRFGPDIGDDEH
jgi:hypothetical protein